jgi:hypothetical protein
MDVDKDGKFCRTEGLDIADFFVEEDKTYIRIVYGTWFPYEEEIKERSDYFIMKPLRQDDRDSIILGSNFE